MNVLSLFDGISCGQIALNNLGIKYDNYFASEVDKNAIKITQYNYPDTLNLGDVTKITGDELPHINLMFGGFPCQDFSIAGKRAGLEGDSGKLFFELLRLKNKLNPDYFLFENNQSMKKEIQVFISEKFGLYPVRINSGKLSAQMRDRIYWTNFRTREMNLFGDIVSDIPQPKDLKLVIKDILQPDDEVDKKYYLSHSQIQRIFEFGNGSNFNEASDKSGTITCGEGKIQNSTPYLKIPFQGMDVNKKSRTVRSTGSQSQSQKHNHDIIQVNPSKESGGKQPFQQNRIFDSNGKATTVNAQLSTGSDKIVVHNMQPRSGDPSKGGTGHLSRENGKAYSLMTSPDAIEYQSVIRRYTPREVCNLQTIPISHFYDMSKTETITLLDGTQREIQGKQIVSDSAIYKGNGNGWTIKVIEHILSFMPIIK